MAELDLTPQDVLICSGIGQAAKLNHYVNTHFLHGLHGRSISNATGAKAANPKLVVLDVGGDGDRYAEGGNHIIHTIRRNPDITALVHDNRVYGLTKGQASPTSPMGYISPTTPKGVTSLPLNPIALAVSLDASFVAQAFAGDIEETKEILKKAISHKGFSFVNIFQPCVTFNKINTYQWFKENTYYLGDDYDASDRKMALEKAFETDKLPLGVIYVNNRKTFEESLAAYENSDKPLYDRDISWDKLTKTFERFV
ncbi:MAG: thiamine pyrophosphate-dependent enzyme [Acetomicrobium sp.]